LSPAEFRKVKLELNGTIPRPLLIGSSVVAMGSSIVIVGGSAVCFSFGTSWNKGVYSVRNQNLDDSSGKSLWSYTHTVRPTSSMPQHVLLAASSTDSSPSQPIQVPRIKVDGYSDLQSVLQAGSPVVLEECDLGSCLDEWTLPGLKSKIGPSREVSQLHYRLQTLCDS
jgi:tRNA wybutosine-synthesizing protein 4